MARAGALKAITRDVLEPLWMRKDISLSAVAARLGVTHQGLHHHGRTLGLPPRGHGKDMLKALSDAEFRALWDAGVSCADIMRVAGYDAPWSPQRDLMLLTALGRGAKLRDAAEIAGVTREEAKLRWAALMPDEVSFDSQRALVWVTRAMLDGLRAPA